VKRFEAVNEKSIIELKRRQKNRQSSKIKRQANQGLEGILREGRGHWHLAFPYLQKSVNYISIAPNKKRRRIGSLKPAIR